MKDRLQLCDTRITEAAAPRAVAASATNDDRVKIHSIAAVLSQTPVAQPEGGERRARQRD